MRENNYMSQVFELIVSIVNRGYSDTVMEAARHAGASGGTVLHARGTGTHEVEKFFGITIQPEKEILLIVSKKEARNDIMRAIVKAAGLNTEGSGISFSLPVSDVLGIANGISPDTE